jgi:hypothetical protein
MTLEADETDILDSAERGEWRSARAPKRALSRYHRSAKATFKKGSPPQHSDFDQGFGKDPEARA